MRWFWVGVGVMAVYVLACYQGHKIIAQTEEDSWCEGWEKGYLEGLRQCRDRVADLYKKQVEP